MSRPKVTSLFLSAFIFGAILAPFACAQQIGLDGSILQCSLGFGPIQADSDNSICWGIRGCGPYYRGEDGSLPQRSPKGKY
jgi:hypothetical protein